MFGGCLDGILKKSGVYILGGGLGHIFEMCMGYTIHISLSVVMMRHNVILI